MTIRWKFVLLLFPVWVSSEALCQQTQPSSQPTELTPKDLFAKASPAVVRIIAGNASGSGFFVSSKGLVVTNYHVIEGATSITVVLENNAKLEVKRVVIQDKIADLALLETGADNVPFLSLATTKPSAGEKVYAIGNPRGLKNTITDGIVSGMRDDGTTSYVQTSTPISPGSSGGPLLLATGEVIGVTTFTYLRSQNLNFAVLSLHVDKLIKDGAAKQARATQPSDGLATEEDLKDVLASIPKELLPSGGPQNDLKLRLANKWLDDKYAYEPIMISGIFTSGGVYERDLVYVKWVGRQNTWLGKSCRIEGLAGIDSESYKAITQLHNGDRIKIRGIVLGNNRGIVIEDGKSFVITVSVGGCSISKDDSKDVLGKDVAVQPQPTTAKETSDEDKAKKQLELAQTYIKARIETKAKAILEDIVKQYPQTTAADTARQRLKGMQEDTSQPATAK